MHSFIACDIPDGPSRVQIGFDQILPLALSTRDLGTRLLSPQGYDWYTVNPLLSPPGGLFISNLFEGGLNRDEGDYLRGEAYLI